MNNQELEQKIKNIISISNFFDMIEAVNAFEKEYKTSDFFKNTKMPLSEVIKNSKVWYLINFDTIFANIQEMLNSLDYNKVQSMIEQFGNVFDTENQEVTEQLKQINEMNFNFLKK